MNDFNQKCITDIPNSCFFLKSGVKTSWSEQIFLKMNMRGVLISSRQSERNWKLISVPHRLLETQEYVTLLSVLVHIFAKSSWLSSKAPPPIVGEWYQYASPKIRPLRTWRQKLRGKGMVTWFHAGLRGGLTLSL